MDRQEMLRYSIDLGGRKLRAIGKFPIWAVLMVVSTPLAAQSDEALRIDIHQRGEDVAAVLKGEKEPENVFASAFLAEVPASQLTSLTHQLEAQFGPLIGLDHAISDNSDKGMIFLRFERAVASGPVQLDASPPHKILGLRLLNFEPIDDSAQRIAAEIAALPGDAGIYFAPLDGGEALVTHNENRQLAIGSSFKLHVLSALAHSIALGEHQWDEVVPLTERSFPSGIAQDWPSGTPVTLQTLATLMISISDNTATDQLLSVLGRSAVEREFAASGNANLAASTPVLKTREMFALKTRSDAELTAYLAGNAETRLKMLDSLAAERVTATDVNRSFADGPHHIDIEWFASARDIAGIFKKLRDAADPVVLDILAISPSMAPNERTKWSYVGYKGGSEPGVLSLAWLLRDTAGRWYVLTLMWNNSAAAVESTTLQILAQRALALAPPRQK